MTLTTLQYLMIFLKSLSIDFFPKSSDHFLEALVKAFFLLLYLIKSHLNYKGVEQISKDTKQGVTS